MVATLRPRRARRGIGLIVLGALLASTTMIVFGPAHDADAADYSMADFCVYAPSNLAVNYAVNGGLVGSAGKIAMNSGGYALGARAGGGSTVNSDSSLGAEGLVANGTVLLNGGALVEGSVHAGGDVTFNKDATIEGNLHVAGNLNNNGGTIGGTIIKGPDVETVGTVSMVTPASYSSDGTWTSGSATLEPGVYGDRNVDDGQTLVLNGPGSFVFGTLQFNSGSTLVIQGGAVSIYTTGAFTQNSGVVVELSAGSSSTNVYLESVDSIQFNGGPGWRGTAYSTGGTVSLNKVDSPYEGAFYSRNAAVNINGGPINCVTPHFGGTPETDPETKVKVCFLTGDFAGKVKRVSAESLTDLKKGKDYLLKWDDCPPEEDNQPEPDPVEWCVLRDGVWVLDELTQAEIDGLDEDGREPNSQWEDPCNEPETEDPEDQLVTVCFLTGPNEGTEMEVPESELADLQINVDYLLDPEDCPPEGDEEDPGTEEEEEDPEDNGPPTENEPGPQTPGPTSNPPATTTTTTVPADTDGETLGPDELEKDEEKVAGPDDNTLPNTGAGMVLLVAGVSAGSLLIGLGVIRFARSRRPLFIY